MNSSMLATLRWDSTPLMIISLKQTSTLAHEVPAGVVEQLHVVPSALNLQPTSHSAMCMAGFSIETETDADWLVSSSKYKYKFVLK